MNRNESISKYMATKLITFKPDTNIWEAIKTIAKKQISGAPVVDEKGQLVGVLSEVDCMRVMLEGSFNEQPGGISVSDFMSSNVTTLDINTSLIDAAFYFAHSKYRRFPITENGKLVGQLSRSDVLRAIANLSPDFKKVPDSWKRRVPTLNISKQGRYSENA